MTAGPDRLAPLLGAGLASLGLELAPKQERLLLDHLALIERWNRVYNLTALREPEQMLQQHVLDSLAVVRPLQQRIAEARWPQPVRLLDVGSGAGLPGVTLAIALPELAVTCIDAVGKKAGFLRQVGAELGLPDFCVVHGRVETLAEEGAFHVITCRAFASLPDFVRLTRPLLAKDGTWVAMKGKRPDHPEIASLPSDVDMFHVEPLTVPGIPVERCLVWMRQRA